MSALVYISMPTWSDFYRTYTKSIPLLFDFLPHISSKQEEAVTSHSLKTRSIRYDNSQERQIFRLGKRKKGKKTFDKNYCLSCPTTDLRFYIVYVTSIHFCDVGVDHCETQSTEVKVDTIIMLCMSNIDRFKAGDVVGVGCRALSNGGID